MTSLVHQTIETVGWTLLHFVWEGAVIALVLAVVLASLRNRPARLRYAARCAALAAMAASPFVTFTILFTAGTGSAPVSDAAFGAAPSVAPTPSVTALTWLVVIWSAGVALLAVRLAGGWIELQRVRRCASRPLPPELRRAFERLCTRIGAKATALVAHSSRIAVPMAMGWLRPVVIVPASLLASMPPEQLEAILAHELAHVRQRDYLVNLVQVVVETLLFYHPAVWWVSRGIRIEREFCCDDVAVDVTGDALVFARALASLECWRGRKAGLSLSANGGILMQRIQRLAGDSSRAGRALPAATALLALGVVGASAIAVALPAPAAKPAETPPNEVIGELDFTLEDGDAFFTVMLEEVADDPHESVTLEWVDDDGNVSKGNWFLTRERPATLGRFVDDDGNQVIGVADFEFREDGAEHVVRDRWVESGENVFFGKVEQNRVVDFSAPYGLFGFQQFLDALFGPGPDKAPAAHGVLYRTIEVQADAHGEVRWTTEAEVPVRSKLRVIRMHDAGGAWIQHDPAVDESVEIELEFLEEEGDK